jgi:hypothetical protein
VDATGAEAAGIAVVFDLKYRAADQLGVGVEEPLEVVPVDWGAAVVAVEVAQRARGHPEGLLPGACWRADARRTLLLWCRWSRIMAGAAS